MALERITQQSPTSAASGATPTGRSAPAGRAQHAKGGVQPPRLGITAKSISQTAPKKMPDTPAQERRATRYRHQRAAASLLPGSRTGLCLWAVASMSYGVDVIHSTAEDRARFSGLQTCGSVWACPCCSGTVSETRRGELNALLAWARAEGLHPVMLTLTARHGAADALPTLLSGMKDAKRRLSVHRTSTALRPRIVGHVTATEVTGGGANGWHPHFHQVMLVRADDQAAALALVETLREPWLASLRRAGLDGAGAAFQVQGATAAGQYLGKWGAAEELALSGKKSGRAGRSPFQLLADYADQGDKRAGALFAEYAAAFKGRRQLVWSPGLKKRAGIDEVSDERAAEDAARRLDESKADALVGHFTPSEWPKVRHARAAILKMAEVVGAAGVDAVARLAKAQHRVHVAARGRRKQDAGGSPKGGPGAGWCNPCPAPEATGSPKPSHGASA